MLPYLTKFLTQFEHLEKVNSPKTSGGAPPAPFASPRSPKRRNAITASSPRAKGTSAFLDGIRKKNHRNSAVKNMEKRKVAEEESGPGQKDPRAQILKLLAANKKIDSALPHPQVTPQPEMPEVTLKLPPKKKATAGTPKVSTPKVSTPGTPGTKKPDGTRTPRTPRTPTFTQSQNWKY
jgi:hypothetical protein